MDYVNLKVSLFLWAKLGLQIRFGCKYPVHMGLFK